MARFLNISNCLWRVNNKAILIESILSSHTPPLQMRYFSGNLSKSHESIHPVINFPQKTNTIIDLPNNTSSFLEIFDRLPLIKNVTLPSSIVNMDIIKPPLSPSSPSSPEETKRTPASIHCRGGIMRIRKSKMNKHKLKKRKKKYRAIIRKVKIGRSQKRAKQRKIKKEGMIQRMEKLDEKHPNNDYGKRPYVIYRLKNW